MLFTLWLSLACTLQETHNDGEPETRAPAAVQGPREARREQLRAKLGEARTAPVEGLFEADVTEGAALFAQRCAGCHGPRGAGDGPQAQGPMLDLAQTGRFFSNAELLLLLREGWPEVGHEPMAGGASEAQLLQLAAWMNLLREPAPKTKAPSERIR